MSKKKTEKIVDSRVQLILKNKNQYNRKISNVYSIDTLFYTQEGLENNKSFIEKLKDKRKRKSVIEEYKPFVDESVERFNVDLNTGLSEEQVKARFEANLTNKTKVASSKSVTSILVKNIFTFFNMLWLIIAVALIWVGSYKDLIFVFVIVANTAIAIIQELRAKFAVEKLSLVTSPLVKTIRDGKIIEIPADQLVLDDIILLTSGNQIPSDSIILNGNVEVNESLLTGESNAIEKGKNDNLLSGSFIVSGECYAKVDKIEAITIFTKWQKKQKNLKLHNQVFLKT